MKQVYWSAATTKAGGGSFVENIEASHVEMPDGRRLGYQQYGDPSGKPILWFHGWIGSRLDFAPNDAVAKELGLKVIAPDRPGCGSSDFQPNRSVNDWPDDVTALADGLGIGRFGVIGHSFGGPFVAACAHSIPERVSECVIVAGIASIRVKGITKGMKGPGRFALQVGAIAPPLTKPFVSGMASMTRRPETLKKGLASMLPEDEAAILDSPGFAGFADNMGEMVKNGNAGAYADAKAFLGDWRFDPADIEIPVQLFYGSADSNVPLPMGEWYRDTVPDAELTVYEGEGHFIMYTRAREILSAM
ncbi:MAG: alpha/beta fold hydrolase [Acidimicrobiia bacterium]